MNQIEQLRLELMNGHSDVEGWLTPRDVAVLLKRIALIKGEN